MFCFIVVGGEKKSMRIWRVSESPSNPRHQWHYSPSKPRHQWHMQIFQEAASGLLGKEAGEGFGDAGKTDAGRFSHHMWNLWFLHLSLPFFLLIFVANSSMEWNFLLHANIDTCNISAAWSRTFVSLALQSNSVPWKKVITFISKINLAFAIEWIFANFR